MFTLNLTLFNHPQNYPNTEAVIGDFTVVNLLNICHDSRHSYAHSAQHIQVQLWEDLEHRRFSGVRTSEALIHSGRSHALMPVVFISTLDINGETTVQDLQDTTRFILCPDVSITQTPQARFDHQVIELAGEPYFNWDAAEQLSDTMLPG